MIDRQDVRDTKYVEKDDHIFLPKVPTKPRFLVKMRKLRKAYTVMMARTGEDADPYILTCLSSSLPVPSLSLERILQCITNRTKVVPLFLRW